MTGRYRISFTGPSRLTAAQEALAVETVRGLLLPAEITTGACTGWDMAVAAAALELWPDAHHRIIVPAAPYDAATLDRLLALHPGLIEVVRAPDAPEPYRKRNEWLVAHADVLIAGLRTLHVGPSGRRYRSGETMTVNIARAAGVPVELVDLSAVPA